MSSELPSASVTSEPLLPWFVRDQQWARAGVPLALILGLLGPFLRPTLGGSRFLIFLHLPLYMLHQVEEHGHGAFKAYAARLLPHARGLTDGTLFVVNIGVWAVNLAALYLARFDRLAQSLIAPYLAVVNGVLHLVMALRARRYNPGLWTGLIVLLPLGGASLAKVSRESRATCRDQIMGLGGSILIHVFTVLGILFAGKKK